MFYPKQVSYIFYIETNAHEALNQMDARIETIKYLLTSTDIPFKMLTPTSLECELGKIWIFKGELRCSSEALEGYVSLIG